ncbi:MAG: zf-HC2 domain-containing protein [Chloroflexota bacterium]|nr:zf-HC2 domain-containing protein [Chloroflexota bacterium]
MRQLLSDGYDRTLTTGELTGLRAHLATCPGCRAFERDLQAGLAGIARLPRVSGSAHVREAVMAGVHPGGRSAWPRGWRDWTGQTLKLAGAMTAFALVAVILVTVFSSTGTGEPDARFSGTGSQRGGPFIEPTATPDPAGAAADSYVPQPCVPGQVEFETAVDAIPGDAVSETPAFVRIGVHALKSTGGTECLLATPISLEISDANGTPLDILGNPATGAFDATLGAQDARVEFAWLNWCGAPGPFNLTVEVITSSYSGSTTEGSTHITPICEDETQPSKLGLADPAQPFPNEGSCQDGNVATTTSSPNEQGDLSIWFIVSNDDACGDDTLVTLRLTDELGIPLVIDGNEIDLTLKPSESGEYEWVGVVWSNWCGEPDGVRLDITYRDSGFGQLRHATPACQDASQPSRMTVSEIAPADDARPGSWEAYPQPSVDTEPPVCDITMLNLSVVALPVEDDVVIDVGASNSDGEKVTCRLDIGYLTVSISGADGNLLEIDGNAVTLDLAGAKVMADASSPRIAHLAWQNWCGIDGTYTVTATLGSQTASIEFTTAPACTDDASPSMLQPLPLTEAGR